MLFKDFNPALGVDTSIFVLGQKLLKFELETLEFMKDFLSKVTCFHISFPKGGENHHSLLLTWNSGTIFKFSQMTDFVSEIGSALFLDPEFTQPVLSYCPYPWSVVRLLVSL